MSKCKAVLDGEKIIEIVVITKDEEALAEAETKDEAEVKEAS